MNVQYPTRNTECQIERGTLGHSVFRVGYWTFFIGVKVVSKPQKKEYGYTSIVEDLDGRKIELTEKSR